MPQWQPGQSGNPRGRPKGRTLTGAIRELLESTSDLKGQPLAEGRTLLDELARVVLGLALAGDEKACRDVWAWLDGRPRQTVPERQGSTVRDAAITRMRASLEGDGDAAPNSEVPGGADGR